MIMSKYIEAVRKNICSICVDSSNTGECQLNEKELCAVEQFLPQIVEVIHTTETDEYEKHYQNLKNKVCKDCRAAEEGGNCYLREDANCSLDRYFHLIVDTIQKVDKGLI